MVSKNDMKTSIESRAETKLIGKKIRMSHAINKTQFLWQDFMTNNKEIKNAFGSDLYSVEVYDRNFLGKYSPHVSYEKWAAVKVSTIDAISDGFESVILPKGRYAVVLYKGKASKAGKLYQYMLSTLIPNSDLQLDHRPHFANMGEKNKNDHEDSEETLWFPIRKD